MNKAIPPVRRSWISMSTYVINNRIPRFPLKAHYPDRAALQKKTEDVFQVWLKEHVISNLVRRKACSQLYDYSVWMEDQGKTLEAARPEEFVAWCERGKVSSQSDWGDFLRYARRRLPALEWEPWD
jgi:hypothetical protein